MIQLLELWEDSGEVSWECFYNISFLEYLQILILNHWAENKTQQSRGQETVPGSSEMREVRGGEGGEHSGSVGNRSVDSLLMFKPDQSIPVEEEHQAGAKEGSTVLSQEIMRQLGQLQFSYCCQADGESRIEMSSRDSITKLKIISISRIICRYVWWAFYDWEIFQHLNNWVKSESISFVQFYLILIPRNTPTAQLKKVFIVQQFFNLYNIYPQLTVR